MNTSPVLLLIFLLSACDGGEQIDSNASGILASPKTQKDILCPDPSDIEPCVCTNDGQLSMSCDYVQDEQQLWQVFSAYFPSTAFYEFKISVNMGLKVLESGVFHNVSFQVIDIWYTKLEIVEEGALTPSLSTLTNMGFTYSRLTTFPFERLPEFTSLTTLSLAGNHIPSIPPLSSSTLQSLDLGEIPISPLSPDVFKGLPAIQRIYLNGCLLTEITPGTFMDLPELKELYLWNNSLSYLQSFTFEIVSSAEEPGLISLSDNDIDYVEEDAFKGVQEFSEIHVNLNKLTRLPERVWRPVLEKGINVTFSANPLTCGCDVAWLVRNPQLLTVAQYGQCVDGKYLTDLDPADFSMCG